MIISERNQQHIYSPHKIYSFAFCLLVLFNYIQAKSCHSSVTFVAIQKNSVFFHKCFSDVYIRRIGRGEDEDTHLLCLLGYFLNPLQKLPNLQSLVIILKLMRCEMWYHTALSRKYMGISTFFFQISLLLPSHGQKGKYLYLSMLNLQCTRMMQHSLGDMEQKPNSK